ncbi:hypothetical protein Ocin01_19464 [Orchesella cincta]|uniref:Uncharacterized protein n=1 Tax=Orchesella cincta TaxID=48709 RepID=A0A1D2M2M2_ORCCI|nr:hypothetical protein Ocin01_19464 [Orchesella cincta]
MRLSDLCNFHLTHGHYEEGIKALKYVYGNSDDCLHVMPSEDTESCNELLVAIYFVPAVSYDEKVRRRHAKLANYSSISEKIFHVVGKSEEIFTGITGAKIAVSLGEGKLLKKLHHVASSQGDGIVATKQHFESWLEKPEAHLLKEEGHHHHPEVFAPVTHLLIFWNERLTIGGVITSVCHYTKN